MFLQAVNDKKKKNLVVGRPGNEASLILHNCFVPSLIVFCVMFNIPCVDCVEI